ncbi:glycosyl hydrolase [Aliarcobacter trophiarum LMG 25534]|uniref:Glycosyl hydrolase n=1 Tax=Aliarcobacter trophiarum LMG 25534 TaxID=1032241 RepID=A0AAD0QJD7_9BACT|nr:glycoside hydrolase family 3 N-terminal domain-containing protein [Aliarcobacter trophiarum]AXK49134.1 glycosyl hydrolase, family 3 [Aliarcobacter trophiarum LMG 25534]RXI26439.1 glycosyl hydrolase [Aliarcobacter trophiarum]RXJ89336.1 glycosyl hydrolase [Aliarcobacter trophiarum LMG 25534]
MKSLVVVLFLIVSCFAQENYSKKDIEKMIAKMVVLGFSGTNIDKNSKIYKDIEFGLGGVILFDKDPNDKTKAKNIENKTQLKRLNQQLQNISNRKLLISIDQEGGIVQRLKSDMGFVNTLKASQISQNGEVFAKQSYEAMAKDLSSVGINLDFAPVVDLAINKDNKVVVTRGRSFGETSKIVTKYASIFVDELKKEGVISTLKHFPGHGSSLADSHLGFVDISKTWDKKELEPYKYFIKNNKVDMIMTAHVFNENLDKEYPATLSYNINTKLLREELGFNGVLITDDLQMSAISKHYDLKQTLTLAINSGVNLLLFANQLAKPISLEEIVNTVYSQILSEEILLEKIIESNRKIDLLQEKLK